MRKTDREIKTISEIEEVLFQARVCRLGILDGNTPYIVPLSFGYRDRALYFHSSSVGKKISLIRINGDVSFEFDIDCEVISADEPCGWTMSYRSVIGRGRASLLEDREAKIDALNVIMKHYCGKEFSYPGHKVDNTAIIRVDISEMTGKKNIGKV